jgi:arabinan endo-1,5-alpha-L-arabinosidase
MISSKAFNLGTAAAGLSALLLIAGCRTAPTAAVVEPKLLELTGDLGVHDPVLIKEKGTYYVFCTGGGRRSGGVLPIRSSTNLLHWTQSGFVFERVPAWGTNEIPRARGAWAPDISYFNGRYHLYYSLSSFGVNESAIGLAVNETLDPGSPNYQWADQGLVVRSREGVDDFNAIDPQLAIEDADNIWLCWGSFWGGLKMRRVDPVTGKLSTTDTNLHSLASRPRGGPHLTPPQEGAIEAPTIVRHGQWWYLFASYDFCCRGTNSTYNVRVGRSAKITGPYLDRAGRPMLDDGGTIVIEATTSNWRGPGHQTVFSDGAQDYLVFHAYHGQTGRPELKISTLVWEDGWPRVAKLP